MPDQQAPVSREVSSSSSSGWERVRFISSELRMTLRLLVAEDTLRPGVASPELIRVLMNYLGEVTHLRRTGQLGDSSATSEAACLDYRMVLEELNRMLPKIERQLRDDHSRLAQEQGRLGLASAWTSTTKLTR
jgi:hypothetical protein